eukprot:TRINITY_DN629_c0_g2_i1.p1 TRINITY_DN629_c0_g2~~TRINITY_DN629_c0_g2_i1.p1  ORF type:complete len:307 (+),score=83.12 TRINITY_DN629_c0_g2_i1:38-922(+)
MSIVQKRNINQAELEIDPKQILANPVLLEDLENAKKRKICMEASMETLSESRTASNESEATSSSQSFASAMSSTSASEPNAETVQNDVKSVDETAVEGKHQQEKKSGVSVFDVHKDMLNETAGRTIVRNFARLIDTSSEKVLENDLFEYEALEAYACKNLQLPIPEGSEKYFTEYRGGGQGDYSQGMEGKIANVVDCLNKFPQSKRAVITFFSNPAPSHTCDHDQKCMREMHFYLDDSNRLCATANVRAQAAEIFPKNFYFAKRLLQHIQQMLDAKYELGPIYYSITTLVADRM